MKRTIRDIIQHLDSAPIECGGFSRAAYTLLHEQHLQATFMKGKMKPSTVDGKEISLHCWLECFGCIIDYRAKMWIGEGAPHGVYTVEEMESLGFIYEGKATPITPLKKEILEFMIMPITNLMDNLLG